MHYLGEHLSPGRLGQFFIILSFGTSFLAAISYYSATTDKKASSSWRLIGRLATQANLAALIGIGSTLFYIIYNHFFEYYYAWAHSSKNLPLQYVISCFWEGQEGSFWLWAFWQSLLANLLTWKAKTWENPVLTVIMASQAMLSSMLIGVEVFGIGVGSSPFVLLRNAIEAPIFAQPAYLSLIADGNGLNPLLQNYWMVIHPPTLFLGFASTIVPFAYAIAGLWQRKYQEWIPEATPWALFAGMILGAGIIMGSLWAYEALSFGGFWAWDPVENASLVPWLVLIAAIHVMLACKHTGHSYSTATILVLISFVLVLYASFLTRSGILGDTSVHAFTDLGMFWHLVAYILLFLTFAVWLLLIRWKELPRSTKEEETYSREFWLFIGALILSLSCIQILTSTSIPVINAIFKTKMAPPPIHHYTKWQLPFAVLIALLSGFTQYLKYKNTSSKRFFVSLSISMFLAGIISIFILWITHIQTQLAFIALVTSATFSLISNGNILSEAFINKWKLKGSAIAHMGFALLLIGALVSLSAKKIISVNTAGASYGEEFAKSNDPRENILLNQNEPTRMGRYIVTYVGDSVAGPNTYFQINYRVVDSKGFIKENFNLFPSAQQNIKMRGLIAAPSAKHYLWEDVYTHVSSIPVKPQEAKSEDQIYEKPSVYQVSLGDTMHYNGGFIIAKSIKRLPSIQNLSLSPKDVAVEIKLEVHVNQSIYIGSPIYIIKGNHTYDFSKNIDQAGLKLRLTRIFPKQNRMEIMVYKKRTEARKWIVMKAMVFPYINLLWAGAAMMIIGFLLAIFKHR